MQARLNTAGRTGQRLRSFELASLAKHALIAEAELTPKPGLVDGRGSGAQRELSLETMRRAACAIEPFFQEMAEAARSVPRDVRLRAALGEIGRTAEPAMYRATGGSNAHKGAIWSLGLLVAAARVEGGASGRRVAQRAGQFACLPDRVQLLAVSHGEAMRMRHGVSGARGEARAGFPHVTDVGLLFLREARARGLTEAESRLEALLHIMAVLDDTCVLYRGGTEALEFVKAGAGAVLEAGGPGSAAGESAYKRFDREMLRKRFSPGGSADLLAATLFLDAFERDWIEYQERGLCNGSYGAD